VSFLVVWLAIAAAGGLLFEALYHPAGYSYYSPSSSTSDGWSPVIIGVVVCAVLASLGIFYFGSSLMLRVSGAVPADPARVLG
jgi:hypothetical protein